MQSYYLPGALLPAETGRSSPQPSTAVSTGVLLRNVCNLSYDIGEPMLISMSREREREIHILNIYIYVIYTDIELLR